MDVCVDRRRIMVVSVNVEVSKHLCENASDTGFEKKVAFTSAQLPKCAGVKTQLALAGGLIIMK